MSELDDDDLVRLGKDLRFAEPPRDRIEEMRTAVLASMPDHSTSRRRGRTHWLFGGFGVAAAAVIGIWLTRPSGSRAPLGHATIVATGDAKFTRMSSSPDELVRMSDGMVHVEVSPLSHDERFRIVVGDSEIEVRGTAFDVEARRDRLVRVSVGHGLVEVRSHGAARLLGPGDRWDAPTIAIAPAAAAPPVIAPSRVETLGPSGPNGPRMRSLEAPKHASATRPRPPSVDTESSAQIAERTFRIGWNALQAGDAATAADNFDRAIKLDPGGPLAEDAEFWRAGALARARRGDAAQQAYVTFLSDFPHSVRTGEASALLGWLRLDAGDLAGAEAQFKQASNDPASRVRASASAGLAEVARRRE